MPTITLALVVLGCAFTGANYLVVRWRRLPTSAASRPPRADEKREAIIRHLTHESLTLLETIHATSELLMQERPDTARDRKHILAMQEASNGLMAVARNVNALLTPLASTVTGTFDLRQMLDEAMACRLSRAIFKRIHFELHVEPNAPQAVETDADLLGKLLGNILDHSLAVTTQGYVEVTLHAAEDDMVRISIYDSGPTLSREVLSHLFEPYGLTGRTLEGNPPGTGLSLYAAHQMAQAIGGELQCSGNPLSGNVFVLRIPSAVRSRADNPLRAATNVIAHNDPYAQHRAQFSPKRLLLVEDQASNAHVIASTLERAGHEVTIASDGHTALSLLDSEHYDAAIIDLGLPGIKGLDVIKLSRLRGNGRKQGIPFIVLTGEISDRVRQDCFVAGAWAFLQKPMSSQRLLETIVLVFDRAERVDKLEPFEAHNIILNVAHAALLNGDPSKMLFDSFRDILHYQREMESAATEGQWDMLLVRALAVHGAAYLIGAERVAAACRRISSVAREDLPGAWPDLCRDLGDCIDGAWQTMCKLLKQHYDNE